MSDFNLEDHRGADGLFPSNIVEVMVGQDTERRRVDNAIRSIVVANPRFNQAYDLLKNTLGASRNGREGQCKFIYGPSGVGKSTVLDYFESQYGMGIKTPEELKRPVLRINIPGRPDLGALYQAILTKLGAIDAASRNVGAMKGVVDAQLRNQDTRMLILDEFTHVIEDKTEKFAKMVVRELKGFISENVCDVVFVGTEQIVQVSDLYSQIQRRTGEGELLLLPFDWQDEDDRQEWVDWLGVVGEMLPIPSSTPLQDRGLALQVHHASNGLVNSVMKLLLFASLNALELGDDNLREDHFWRGFDTGRTIFSPRDAAGHIDNSVANPFVKPKGAKPKPRAFRFARPPDVTDQTYLHGRRKTPKPSFSK